MCLVPFVVKRNVTVVEGGYLRAPWCPDLKEVNDNQFVKLEGGDRGLAAAMGMDLSAPKPFNGVDLFNFIARKRDDAIDVHIRTYQQKSDPMGTAIALNARVTKRRDAAYASANVPSVISVDIPSFKDSDGKDVDAMTLLVLSTNRRLHAPMVMIDDHVLDWMVKAVYHIWTVGAKRVHASTLHVEFDLPELPSGMKYRKRADSISVCVQYADGDGKWKTHQQTVSKSTDLPQETFEALLAPVIQQMEKFLEENDHGELAEDTPGDAVHGVDEPVGEASAANEHVAATHAE